MEMKIKPEDLKNYVGKKIKHPMWDIDRYLIVTAIGHTKFLGLNADGKESFYEIEGTWETYEEPKQKVKKWQALYERDGVHYSTEQFYISDEEARFNFMRPVNFIKLLPHTEIEVDL